MYTILPPVCTLFLDMYEQSLPKVLGQSVCTMFLSMYKKSLSKLAGGGFFFTSSQGRHRHTAVACRHMLPTPIHQEVLHMRPGKPRPCEGTAVNTGVQCSLCVAWGSSSTAGVPTDWTGKCGTLMPSSSGVWDPWLFGLLFLMHHQEQDRRVSRQPPTLAFLASVVVPHHFIPLIVKGDPDTMLTMRHTLPRLACLVHLNEKGKTGRHPCSVHRPWNTETPSKRPNERNPNREDLTSDNHQVKVPEQNMMGTEKPTAPLLSPLSTPPPYKHRTQPQHQANRTLRQSQATGKTTKSEKQDARAARYHFHHDQAARNCLTC